MDTPQVTPELLDAGLAALEHADAAFGAALDGGYWGIGLRRPDPEAFRDVPMSEPTTGAFQRARLDDARPHHRRPAAPPRRRHDRRRLRRRRRGAAHPLRHRPGDARGTRRRMTTALRGSDPSVVSTDQNCGTTEGSDPLTWRCPPTSSTGGCWRRPRSMRWAVVRRRGRGCGRSTGRSSRCRSTAGSAGSTPPTGRRWRWPRRRCSTSAAGPGGISPRCDGPGSGRSAWTSPPSPCGSRAGAAGPRSPVTCSARCPAPGAGGRRCCSTATSASAAPPLCSSAGRASCWRPAGSRSWSSTRRARRRSGRGSGSRRRTW